jgi:hypothetical protein
MRTERRIVKVSCGNSSFDIEDWTELWGTVWRVVAFSIGFKLAGKCLECGCKIKPCDYCAHECYSTPDVLDVLVCDGCGARLTITQAWFDSVNQRIECRRCAGIELDA